MNHSSYRKVITQLQNKPIKKKKFMKHSVPKKRSCGKARIKCRICGRMAAIVGQYNINMCRQCFRERATKIGFVQYS